MIEEEYIKKLEAENKTLYDEVNLINLAKIVDQTENQKPKLFRFDSLQYGQLFRSMNPEVVVCGTLRQLLKYPVPGSSDTIHIFLGINGSCKVVVLGSVRELTKAFQND